MMKGINQLSTHELEGLKELPTNREHITVKQDGIWVFNKNNVGLQIFTFCVWPDYRARVPLIKCKQNK